MTDAELMTALDLCRLPPGVPPPPKGFYLEECLRALTENGRTVETWGGGDSYAEEAFRVVRAFLPDLGVLLLPPFCVLLLGVTIWLVWPS
jgi:hypothetical protein